jgi:hypothetical protein
MIGLKMIMELLVKRELAGETDVQQENYKTLITQTGLELEQQQLDYLLLGLSSCPRRL